MNNSKTNKHCKGLLFFSTLIMCSWCKIQSLYVLIIINNFLKFPETKINVKCDCIKLQIKPYIWIPFTCSCLATGKLTDLSFF